MFLYKNKENLSGDPKVVKENRDWGSSMVLSLSSEYNNGRTRTLTQLPESPCWHLPFCHLPSQPRALGWLLGRAKELRLWTEGLQLWYGAGQCLALEITGKKTNPSEQYLCLPTSNVFQSKEFKARVLTHKTPSIRHKVIRT